MNFIYSVNDEAYYNADAFEKFYVRYHDASKRYVLYGLKNDGELMFLKRFKHLENARYALRKVINLLTSKKNEVVDFVHEKWEIFDDNGPLPEQFKKQVYCTPRKIQ